MAITCDFVPVTTFGTLQAFHSTLNLGLHLIAFNLFSMSEYGFAVGAGSDGEFLFSATGGSKDAVKVLFAFDLLEFVFQPGPHASIGPASQVMTRTGGGVSETKHTQAGKVQFTVDVSTGTEIHFLLKPTNLILVQGLRASLLLPFGFPKLDTSTGVSGRLRTALGLGSVLPGGAPLDLPETGT